MRSLLTEGSHQRRSEPIAGRLWVPVTAGFYKAGQDSAKLETRGDTLLPVAAPRRAQAHSSRHRIPTRQPPGALRLRTCAQARPAFRPPNHRRARPTKQCSLRARVESPILRPTRREKRRGEVCVSVVFHTDRDHLVELGPLVTYDSPNS